MMGHDRVAEWVRWLYDADAPGRDGHHYVLKLITETEAHGPERVVDLRYVDGQQERILTVGATRGLGQLAQLAETSGGLQVVALRGHHVRLDRTPGQVNVPLPSSSQPSIVDLLRFTSPSELKPSTSAMRHTRQLDCSHAANASRQAAHGCRRAPPADT
jgi:hypothetical protein